ncbi:hypothetical protein MNBD_CHLOROFLEXI01-4366 [hydrothermal vent metagenome]|uniref:Three-Cys-motif partner protein TcmP n=1 Tax=hydrothermal vent metagenome TaxID=652676 RepID=A0A3B0VM15_9ZZZZ
MPKEDGVGYGEFTARKIDHLKKIIAMHLAVTSAVILKYHKPYRYRKLYKYVDLTSGKGFSPDGKIPGSPLVFLRNAESKLQIPYRADFIEEVEKNIIELQSNVADEIAKNNWNNPDIHFHLGKYQALAKSLFGQRDLKEFGLIFVDPSGNAPDFDALKQICTLRPKMEILIYVSTTSIKRIYQHTNKLLSDYMQDIGKKYWLVRKPINWDQYKWTFLMGSNSDIFKDYKKIDFLRLDSSEAQAFFPKLNLSEKQRQAAVQSNFFDILLESGEN